MREIWFIRHAESEANAGLATSDPALIALTPKGVQQSHCIPTAFHRSPELIVTSPYIRTKQTAQPTIERFPDIPQDEWPVHEFTYLSLAHREHTTAQQRKPLIEAYWNRCDPLYVDGAGAESFAQLLHRIEHTLHRIRDIDAAFVAIFGHGLFVRALLWILLSDVDEGSALTMQRFRHFLMSDIRMPNASILKLHYTNAGELLVSPFITTHLPPELRCTARF
jgi:broad specificity phosphatase PhoE